MDNKDLKSEYKELFKKVADIFIKYDPLNIINKNNTDEYDPETASILPRLKNCASEDGLLDMIHQVFIECFDGALMTGEREKYKPIARELWQLKGQFLG